MNDIDGEIIAVEGEGDRPTVATVKSAHRATFARKCAFLWGKGYYIKGSGVAEGAWWAIFVRWRK